MGAGIVAGAGWWILAAQLTPAADRPYFGGSTSNSILQLAIGYNGLGRLTGNETGSVSPGGGGGGQGVSFEIGRASCRERVEISVVAVSVKKKHEMKEMWVMPGR